MNKKNHDPRASSMKESIQGKGILKTKGWLYYKLSIFPKHKGSLEGYLIQSGKQWLDPTYSAALYLEDLVC